MSRLPKSIVLFCLLSTLGYSCNNDYECIKSLQPLVQKSSWNYAELRYFNNKIEEEKAKLALEKTGLYFILAGALAASYITYQIIQR